MYSFTVSYIGAISESTKYYKFVTYVTLLNSIMVIHVQIPNLCKNMITDVIKR